MLDQVLNERVVVGRLAGHGDHDGDATIRRNVPEQPCGMLRQESLSRFEIDHRCLRLVGLPRAAQGPVKDGQHGVDRRQDVGLRAPERREAHSREPQLQRSEVTAA